MDPAVDDPVFNVKSPLVPALPPSAVFRVNAPLEVAELLPLLIDIDPPVSSDLPATITIRPPTPLSPVPAAMLMLPPTPLEALPLEIATAPLEPDIDTPVLMTRAPETPLAPLLNDFRVKAPLLDDSPDPETIDIDPPVNPLLIPADTVTRPPEPPEDDPVTKLILPAAPALPTSPDVIAMDPLSPADANPDFRVTRPLRSPFPERIVNAPLAYPDPPAPLLIDTLPPSVSVLSPAATTIRPPSPSLPEPTAMLTLPPTPLVAIPLIKAIEPLLPLFADPVENVSSPLTPVGPESAVRIVNEPLDFVTPIPLDMETEPPVDSSLPPALTTTRPPDPAEPSPTMTLMLPPAPLPEDEPEAIRIDPLPPEDAEPVLIDKAPLVPVEPESDVRMVNAPLDEALP